MNVERKSKVVRATSGVQAKRQVESKERKSAEGVFGVCRICVRVCVCVCVCFSLYVLVCIVLWCYSFAWIVFIVPVVIIIIVIVNSNNNISNRAI